MNELLRSSKRFVKRNASIILTCAGGVGVITTSVMAAKATPRALKLLEQAEDEKGDHLTKTEKVVAAAPAYIPTVIMGATTIACIFGVHIVDKRKQAALVSAYAFLDNSYKEYKKKVKEMYGEDADNDIRTELSKDKYDKTDIPKNYEDDLFFDEFSGRFFKSTLTKVQRAEYELNRDLVMRDWATINDFYEHLKIPLIDGGDEIGWSTSMNEQAYWQTWVDFSNPKTIANDGSEYYIVRMFQEPMPGFADFGDVSY